MQTFKTYTPHTRVHILTDTCRDTHTHMCTHAMSTCTHTCIHTITMYTHVPLPPSLPPSLSLSLSLPLSLSLFLSLSHTHTVTTEGQRETNMIPDNKKWKFNPIRLPESRGNLCSASWLREGSIQFKGVFVFLLLCCCYISLSALLKIVRQQRLKTTTQGRNIWLIFCQDKDKADGQTNRQLKALVHLPCK